MKTLVFATHNQNKVAEVAALMQNKFKILSLTDIGCLEPIPEIGNTFAENAFIKANFVYEKYQLPCFADDSGLEVAHLNGEPGIYSARYAGTGDSRDNIELVLQKLKEESNRKANFITLIALVGFGKLKYFEGKIFGTIEMEPIGTNGFGYDAIFTPENHSQTFAEMPAEFKNRMSHRGIAINALISYLLSA